MKEILIVVDYLKKKKTNKQTKTKKLTWSLIYSVYSNTVCDLTGALSDPLDKISLRATKNSAGGPARYLMYM